MTVRILEDHVINQIAAGEVVERPASVVKELVENALDAGARTVDVFLVDGGKQRIRITDDGSGMHEQDALLCIERHATSKIRRAEDLHQVGTLGFRGEALPSIAAVCRFELRTRPAAAETGHRVRVEGGKLTDVRAVGCHSGTEIDVRSLFFNVPARRKFLRTRATELHHCLETLHRVALMRPDVDFTVRHGERVLVRAPQTHDLKERAIAILGPDARALQPVRVQGKGYEVVGLCSPPGVSRSTANGALYLYVNGRWVKDAVLRRAVRQAYRDLAPAGRYPIVVLDLRIPPELVDVNVHPTKSEVRFTDPRGVTCTLAEGLREAVLAAGRMPDPRPRPHRGPREAWAASLPLAPPPSAAPDPPEPYQPSIPALPPGPAPVTLVAAEAEAPEVAAAVAVAPAPSPTPSRRLRGKRVVGLLRERWILLEAGPELWVVDGGRGELRLRVAELGPHGARLLVPVRVSLASAEVALLMGREADLAALGLEMVRFGPREIAVKTLPAPFAQEEPERVLEVAAAALHSGQPLRQAWGEAMSPPPLPEEEHVIRALIASLEEAGALEGLVRVVPLTSVIP